MAILRRTRPAPIDPTAYPLSPNFYLSDFLGNHSVYSKGFANDFKLGPKELRNGEALAAQLDLILETWGPMSISYGLIGPELSDQIVKYQDPRKPSHHLWNLGAAADILVHQWVEHKQFDTTFSGLWFPESAQGSPIALAHAIEDYGIRYSRLITYSESPYICMAVSADEVRDNKVRRAFYENRYQGKARAKPAYHQYATQQAKNRALELLQDHGLAHPWQGAGHPTYHGGGFMQFQHNRISDYTMLSDWLFDLKSISTGVKNIPSLNLPTVQDSFLAAGIMYDWIIRALQVNRASIIKGYVSHLNPYMVSDWRDKSSIHFTLRFPQIVDVEEAANQLFSVSGERWGVGATYFEPIDGTLQVSINPLMILAGGRNA